MTPITTIGIIFASLYALALSGLAVYGLHSLWLLIRFLHVEGRARAHEAAEAAQTLPADADLPAVLVQLPVFNERDVVGRLLNAVAAFDWPRDRLHIQLLDDSTDDSLAIGEATIAKLRAAGFAAHCLHRRDRRGFKAGALEAGMADNQAPFIAIFDADFVPPADFLKRAIVPLLSDPGLALVQGRWEHLNPDDNPLCRAQAIGIDAHFAIEQSTRAWTGLSMNFNGTCGLWRRQAIIDAGGWEHETLTEDLDLSYRVQLRGWRCTYRLNLAVPGELPADIHAFRAQQFRWAKGSQQCTRKLTPRILRSDWSPTRKIAALLHMSHYAVHPLMLLSLIVAPLALWLSPLPPDWVVGLGAGAFAIGVFAPVITYIVSQRVLRGQAWWRTLARVPLLAAIGTGIAISNSRAVWEAWRGVVSPFVRTPKSGASGTGSYSAHSTTGVPELICSVWAMVGIVLSCSAARPWATPLLVIYCSGFAAVGTLCLRTWLRLRPPRERSGPRWQLASLIAAGLLAAGAYAALGLHPGWWQQAPLYFTTLGLIAGGAYLWACSLSRQGGRMALVVILGFALLFRLLALGIQPSDDLNRYVVEGRQTALGQNPYLVAPGSAEAHALLAGELDPTLIAGVNHADWTAIYPPLTIILEMFISELHPSITAMRLAMIASELIALAFLLAFLLHRGAPTTRLLLVAWNPVLVLWIAGEGHNDALLLAPLAAALWFFAGDRHRLGLISASLAVLAKPFAAPALLPGLITARAKSLWLIPPALALLCCGPFLGAGLGLVGSLGRFGAEKHFHGAIDGLLRPGLQWAGIDPTLHARLILPVLLIILILGSTLLIWRHQRGLAEHGPGDPLALSGKLLTLFLLCLPTLHPWYLAVLVLFLPILPLSALLLWTALSPLYWLHGLGMQGGTAWNELPWVTVLAHAPTLLLLGYGMWRHSKPWRLAPHLALERLANDKRQTA